MRDLKFILLTLIGCCIIVSLVVDAEAVIFGPTQRLPLVKADYQRCVTIRNGPLVPPKKHINGTAPLSDLT